MSTLIYPWDANRLDQRIGRLDRYTVRLEPAEIVVLTEPDSEWVSAQVRLLDAGIGVFDMSVSTVQRPARESAEHGHRLLPAKGVDALNLDAYTLRQNLGRRASQRRPTRGTGISHVPHLCSATPSSRNCLEYEKDTEPLRSAMKRLTSGTGSLALRPTEDVGGRPSHSPERETLAWMSKKFQCWSDSCGQSPTTDRSRSNRQVSPRFRIGDPLVNWLESYLLADERGRAFALVRPLAGISSPAAWLHSEFLIEFDVGQGPALADPERRRLIRRGEGVLPADAR